MSLNEMNFWGCFDWQCLFYKTRVLLMSGHAEIMEEDYMKFSNQIIQQMKLR